MVLYDRGSGEILDNGLITCELSDSAVTKATVSVAPVGLSNNDYGIAPVRNSNGISILSTEAEAGFLTCKITTPVLGYDEEPFAVGDKVLVEGIEFRSIREALCRLTGLVSGKMKTGRLTLLTIPIGC